MNNNNEDNLRKLEAENETLKYRITKLENLTDHDILIPSILNRRGLIQRIEPILHLKKRLKGIEKRHGESTMPRQLCVAFIDVDKFKYINDKMGHDVGDEVLVHIGNFLKEKVREGDFVARWGGDEFVIVFWGDNKTAVQKKLTSISEELSNYDFKFKEQIDITLSFGVSCTSEDSFVHENLIKIAETEMRKNKGEKAR